MKPKPKNRMEEEVMPDGSVEVRYYLNDRLVRKDRRMPPEARAKGQLNISNRGVVRPASRGTERGTT